MKTVDAILEVSKCQHCVYDGCGVRYSLVQGNPILNPAEPEDGDNAAAPGSNEPSKKAKLSN